MSNTEWGEQFGLSNGGRGLPDETPNQLPPLNRRFAFVVADLAGAEIEYFGDDQNRPSVIKLKKGSQQ